MLFGGGKIKEGPKLNHGLKPKRDHVDNTACLSVRLKGLIAFLHAGPLCFLKVVFLHSYYDDLREGHVNSRGLLPKQSKSNYGFTQHGLHTIRGEELQPSTPARDVG